jgi:hypothetical protein
MSLLNNLYLCTKLFKREPLRFFFTQPNHLDKSTLNNDTLNKI